MMLVLHPMDPLPAGFERVRRTAEAELRPLLASFSAPLQVEWSALPASAGPEKFSASRAGDTLSFRGSHPRALLQGVFALQEALAAGEAIVDGWRREGEFHYSERIFHARFQPWPGERADVRFLAHLGATHCLVCHDWHNSRRSLQGYVASPIFPRAIPPEEVAENHRGLRRLLDDCADHGLGAMLWITELPCQGGPWVPPENRAEFLTRYPGDVLSDSGTYEGQVLCFSHPQVQAFYRDLLRRFFADFPEVETLFLFGQDSGGEFCDPTACPRCRGLSPIAQRDRLIRFLVEEGRKVRPGLRVLTTGWGWDQDAADFLRRQAALPAASGLYLAAQKDGWQCERQTHDFLREARAVCRQRGQTFIGYDDFLWGDDTVHGIGDIQDFPLGIGAKLRRWHALGVDGVFDHWGNAPEDSWCNAVACREFFLAPDAEPREVVQRIARRQFGADAGPLAYQGWEALERAQEILSRACTWSPGQWPMWYAGRKAALLPDQGALAELRRSRHPARTGDGATYNPADFSAALQAVSDAWRDAGRHYEEAIRLMTAAESAADDEPVFYRFWWNGVSPTPTRRQHLHRQRLYLESTSMAGREIGVQFGLYALWEKLGGDVTAYRAQCEPLRRAGIEACRAAARYFSALGKPAGWAEQYAQKADRLVTGS